MDCGIGGFCSVGTRCQRFIMNFFTTLSIACHRIISSTWLGVRSAARPKETPGGTDN